MKGKYIVGFCIGCIALYMFAMIGIFQTVAPFNGIY
jgi:hypothetical protein